MPPPSDVTVMPLMTPGVLDDGTVTVAVLFVNKLPWFAVIFTLNPAFVVPVIVTVPALRVAVPEAVTTV